MPVSVIEQDPLIRVQVPIVAAPFTNVTVWVGVVIGSVTVAVRVTAAP